MEKMQLKTDSYTLYGPDSLREIIKPALHILDKKKLEFCKLFGVEDFRPFNIYIFDDIEKYRKFVGDAGSNNMPSYSIGSFDKDIYAYINPEKYKVQNLAHELFHVMYKDLILEKLNKPRIIWYDEGMAQMLSGERYDNSEKYFKWCFLDTLEKTKLFPEKLNELKHEEGTFSTKDYDGYSLGYISVMYLREMLSEDEFKEVLHDPDRVFELGQTVLNDAFDYYNKKYQLVNKEIDLRHAKWFR